MPKYVDKVCEVCGAEFRKEYKKRSHRTCSRACSYKLRQYTRKQEHKPVTKECDRCGEPFEDTSKKKGVTTCKACVYEKMATTRTENGSYERTEEQNRKLSETLKRKYEEGWNPNTEEHKERMSKYLSDRWESGEMAELTKESCLERYGVEHWTQSPEGRLRISQMHKGRQHTDEAKENMRRGAARRVRENNNLPGKGKGGIREDIGHYVRSNWEANFARILRLRGENYEYEGYSFTMKGGVTYTPDFRVGDVFYEVKGYWTKRAKEKVRLFREEHPDIELVIVDAQKYNKLRDEYQHQILWEGK